MNTKIFAEWFRRRGLEVAQTASCYWVNLGTRVFQAFPYHWLIDPDDRELKEFLLSKKAIGLRYSTFSQAPVGYISYHTVFEKPDYDLMNLSKKARYDVRQGLKNCSISRISFTELSQKGWPLQADTQDRHGRHNAMSFNAWRTLCLEADYLPGFEAWGARVNGRLGASAITLQVDDWCYILYQQSDRELLPARLNNALCFAITKEMIRRPDIQHIHYGLHSLDAPSSVDAFKLRMGYAAKSLRQRIVFHPFISPWINRVSHTVVRDLLKLTHSNPALAKAEGMMRLFLQGRRPLEDQEIPEVLKKIPLGPTASPPV
jgi:hypothetical protein